MKVIAIKQGRPTGTLSNYKIGDVYEVTESTARLLEAMGWAKPETEMRPSKRTYKRRDMKAEK